MFVFGKTFVYRLCNCAMIRGCPFWGKFCLPGVHLNGTFLNTVYCTVTNHVSFFADFGVHYGCLFDCTAKA